MRHSEDVRTYSARRGCLSLMNAPFCRPTSNAFVVHPETRDFLRRLSTQRQRSDERCPSASVIKACRGISHQVASDHPFIELSEVLRTLLGMTSFSEAADPELLTMAGAQPEAFGELFKRHSRSVYAYCARRTGNLDLAEDLTSVVVGSTT